MTFQYDKESILIHWILIGFKAILEKLCQNVFPPPDSVCLLSLQLGDTNYHFIPKQDTKQKRKKIERKKVNERERKEKKEKERER